MSNEVDQALSNLAAIKQGTDPREKASESAATSATPQTTTSTDSPKGALATAKREVDRLFEEHGNSFDNIGRENVHVGVARWTGRNGVCKYNKRLNKEKFGQRMSSLPYRTGDHSIVINERIFEQGETDEFIDTVRHELAHAIAYAETGENQKHNKTWKRIARNLGADPSATHHKYDRSDNIKYYIHCTNCGAETGRTKRSKIIKKPFNRMCGRCGHSPMSSYEKGQDPPEEDGVVKVESIPWDNKNEWFDEGMP